MDDVVIPILGIIFAIGMPVILGSILGFVYLRGRNNERIALIEKGIIPQEIETPEKKANRYPALRNGLVLVGIALGIMVGIFMGPVMPVGDWGDLTVLTMAAMFGGIGFIAYFFLSRKMEQLDAAKADK